MDALVRLTDAAEESGPVSADVFVTRLHLHLRHPWRGDYTSCSAASEYASSLVDRRDVEAVALAKLTGWCVNDIQRKMKDGGYSATALQGLDIETQATKISWLQRLWDNGQTAMNIVGCACGEIPYECAANASHLREADLGSLRNCQCRVRWVHGTTTSGKNAQLWSMP